MNKKTLCACLAAIMLASSSAMTVTAENSDTYKNEFTDISSSDWFYSDVVDAYSLGLINGKTADTFAPDKNLTIAETIKLAASVHQLLTTGKIDENAFYTAYGNHWYDGYVNYAFKNGIVTEEYPDYNDSASRAQVAVLFSRAAVSSGKEFKELNPASFGDLPDVPTDMWYAGAVYRMYRWGIMTGDASQMIKPESDIKRREIAAVVMRMIESDRRITVGESSEENDTSDAPTDTPADIPEDSVPEVPDEPKVPETKEEITYTGSLLLYTGNRDSKNFTGITGFAAEFSYGDHDCTVESQYSLDLVNAVILEPDNISFRLYTDSGFEALGIVRGWLNEAARGKNGSAIREKDDVIEAINEIAFLWIDGSRKVISEMWYADHGDYTTYAFYFDEKVMPADVNSVEFTVGKLDRSVLESASMTDMADAVEQAKSEGITIPDKEVSDVSDNYKAAISDAKDTAAEIIFEYETTRCDIIYGRGLYGRESDEYRLIFVFRDGTVQTVASEKLEDIRTNAAGNVLYYNITAPDGKVLRYGINFIE